MYADDTQVYNSVPLNNLPVLVTDFEICISNIMKWMIENKLKMNEDKTEVLACSTTNRSFSSDIDHICIENEQIAFSDKAKNLGVFFDTKLSMINHVSHLCQILFLELRKIKQLSSFLNEAAIKTLISSFVFSRLDYCNSLLSGLPKETLSKLQRIQNNAARLVLRKRKRDHVTPLLKKLHWLPVQARIDYKIAVLCYKCISNEAPVYLCNLVNQHVPSRHLRSSDKSLLSVPPKAKKKSSQGAFVHHAPVIWNSLPLSLRKANSQHQFKAGLKTYLFKSYFDKLDNDPFVSM